MQAGAESDEEEGVGAATQGDNAREKREQENNIGVRKSEEKTKVLLCTSHACVNAHCASSMETHPPWMNEDFHVINTQCFL